MMYTDIYLLLTWVMYAHTPYLQCSEKDGRIPCDQDTGPGSIHSIFREYILPRIDPVQVGHVTTLDLAPGKKHTRVTKAIRPPIFEIPDFLSPAECDHIIKLALRKGMSEAGMLGKDGVFKNTDENSIYTRVGKTTFVPQGRDQIMRGIQHRVTLLTRMPPELIKDSESYQVGHYGVGGHYHSHYDSTETEGNRLPCQHQTPLPHTEETIVLCRYITVLLYLNDVEEGGETAFPFADKTNLTITDKEYNLSKYCHEAPVVVRAKKGKAVMWYNNYRDPETGWLGRVDPRSFHGGCRVQKGEKWIANAWVDAAHYENRYVKGIFRVR